MKTYFNSIVLLGVLFLIFFSLSLHAQTPQLLNYQGKLNNKDGTPASGAFSIVFSIYDDSTGGTVLWYEPQAVTVMNGVFNVLLGSVLPFSDTLFTSKGERYLGIKVGADAEMKPRFRFTSVPYAIKASHADTAQVAIRATSGNTLDQAYDQGGPGAGRTIIADAGSVSIDGPHGLVVNGQGGFHSIELRKPSIPSTPYIDFTNDDNTDNDMRIILKGDDQLFIEGGNVTIGAAGAQVTLDINGMALLGYETSVSDFGSPLKSGFYSNGSAEIPGDVPDNSHGWTHLITSRHLMAGNNYQLQIASTYSQNDLLYFRKVAINNINESSNPPWYEIATRGANTFSGNQNFIDGNVGIGTTIPEGKLHIHGAASNDPSNPTLKISGEGTGANLTMGLRYGNEANAWINSHGNLVLKPDGGSVGIGTPTPSEKLEVIGNIHATAKITEGSSRSLKENITELPLDEAEIVLKKLTPVKFTYKADDNKDQHVGFIAEDVPELVATADRKGLSPMDIVAVLTKVVQQQQREIEALKKQLEK